MSTSCKISVFTPTYNRAHLLPRLYDSLKKQDFSGFEWLIVDDGSTDQTEQTVQAFTKEQTAFPIRYIKQPNGGKHRAINRGVHQAAGELFFIVDSDDWLPEDSLATIWRYYLPIKGTPGFCGVAGCKYDSLGNMSGTSFSGEYVDATSLERGALNIRGEKSEVFVTEILKQYPFPEYPGETFVSEAMVWNRIAADGYKLRWINRNTYIYEYQENGLTNRLSSLYKKNPIGYLTYVRQEMDVHHIGFLRRMVWSGRCIATVDVKDVGKQRIKQILRLSELTWVLARLVHVIKK